MFVSNKEEMNGTRYLQPKKKKKKPQSKVLELSSDVMLPKNTVASPCQNDA